MKYMNCPMCGQKCMNLAGDPRFVRSNVNGDDAQVEAERKAAEWRRKNKNKKKSN